MSSPATRGISDLWEVNLVIVDDAYEAESITSKAALDAAIDDEGYDVMKPGLFVNCPVVGADSTLEEGKELTQGWYRGEPVFYPDFGGNDPVAIPIWAFITGFNDDGTPAFVEGQNNVIDVVKGEAGYSAFWRVNLVQLDAAYEANTLTSAAQVAASGLAVTETDLVVNCPVVRPDATTANAEPRAPAVVRSRQPEQKEYDLVEGWYRGEDVVYYDFAMNSPLDAATSAVGIAPIYAFANGIGADGSPNFVDGQHNVIDLLPGDEGYSDLWQVHLVLVDDNYEAGTITSKAGIDATRYQQQVTNLLVNCPVVGAGSALETGKELVNGYYRERDVFYPDFGGNVAVAIPIWAFVTGFDEDGNPQFVEGQRNIIDAVPADEGYFSLLARQPRHGRRQLRGELAEVARGRRGIRARGGADGPRGQLPGGRADVARSFATTYWDGRPSGRPFLVSLSLVERRLARSAALASVVLECLEAGDVGSGQAQGARATQQRLLVCWRGCVALQVRGDDVVAAAGDAVASGRRDLDREAAVSGRIAEEALLPVELVRLAIIDRPERAPDLGVRCVEDVGDAARASCVLLSRVNARR